MGDQSEQRFIESGTAPEFFVTGLHNVEVMGTNCRFVLYVERRLEDGQIIREAPFTCIMPIDAVAPAIALTLRILGAKTVVPAIARALLH